ncbi:MAG: hypothetical protein LQ344_002060 [Seirophora lacunosa]|nr:MAG: hypothetical protein LQ344_002060 [Seirophora lacunosa]
MTVEECEGYFDHVLTNNIIAHSRRAQSNHSTTAVENAENMAALQQPRISKFVEIDVDGDNNANQEGVAALLQHHALESRSRSSSCQSELDRPTDGDQIAPVFSLHPRLYLLALLVFIGLPLLYDTRWLGMPGSSAIGAVAGPIRSSDHGAEHIRQKRADTVTDVCNRWSGQSALVNGTIYLYGGHATQEPGQKSGTWTNDFLSIDLTKSWKIADPTVKGLPQPSGPPAVANGYLWHSYDSLYLYGGIVSDSPPAEPEAYTLWEYQIKAAKWVEHSNPKTSSGNNSEPGNQPVLQAGEGAGISIPELGRGYYFGGHYDAFTTPGWSIQTNRTYLKALLEFTFPGHSNDGVEALAGGENAGSDGVWRNVTSGGIQDTARFPNRADGSLVYVPGYGDQGLLLSIGGGTAESFSQMNVIDVYDIATSTWYKQATDGEYPKLRVNPCAVAASAPDGSSTNIYVYGGQNLIPYGQQIQYDDMWILSVPSFKWIQVDTTGQSAPPARVGASCSIWDGQIVVVGGYTGPDLSCDSGFYVFSATELKWQNDFTALDGGNTQNQQVSQQEDLIGLGGSYGYEVPGAVQSVIGGDAKGGATITAPVQAATQGPLATGKPITYTVTNSNGATVTQTGTVSASGSSNSRDGPNIGAIVAGVVAGFFAVLAAYLGFCAYVYRRQLALYKNHVAMSQRAAAGAPNEKSSFLPSSTEGSSARNGRSSLTDQSSGVGGASSRLTGASGNGRDTSVPPLPTGIWPPGRNSTANSSNEDLMMGQEPSFVGVLLNPRRSLRVINRD